MWAYFYYLLLLYYGSCGFYLTAVFIILGHDGDSEFLIVAKFLILPLVFLVVMHIIAICIRKVKERKLQKIMANKDFAQIEDISPLEFESWVARLMRMHGYRSYATRGSGDYGVDDIAQKGFEKIGIQVKKFSKPVGIRAVQEIVSGKSYYHCTQGWVISTAPYFTKAAINLAKLHNIKLINKRQLALFFEKARSKQNIKRSQEQE